MTWESAVTPEWLSAAERLWSEGLSVTEIAARTGIPRGTASGRVYRYRELFPHRIFDEPEQAPAEHRPPRRTFFEGRWIEHVTREVNGVEITMPRVSFIDGDSSTTHASGADHD